MPISTIAFGLAMLAGTSALAQSVPRAALKVLHNFGKGSDGRGPGAGMIRDAQGNFYGTTEGGGAYGVGTVFKLDSAGKETILTSFNGNNGKYPDSNLVQDSGGNLYGATFQGGAYGWGTVFKVDPSGNETVLYAFTFTGGDGADAQTNVAQDAAGNLYGTTSYGGDYSHCTYGCGTVWKVDPSGNETVLYRFTGSGGDGSFPLGGVIVDNIGNIYGTTSEGGSFKGVCAQTYGCGTVFKLDSAGHETVLHKFHGVHAGGHGDGSDPNSQLTMDSEGNIYGATASGGYCSDVFNCGTVFKIDANEAYTVLYRFGGRRIKKTGTHPWGPFTLDQEGNLYGATQFGGKYDSYGPSGAIFELTTAGQLNLLFSFTSDVSEPKQPNGGLILDAEGNIYGTAQIGGPYGSPYGYGAVFEIKP
ncbi:MAG TPA: choice-of-anchor tandem repeat GloVer-containing protein [Bryobacteraceae bacterium]